MKVVFRVPTSFQQPRGRVSPGQDVVEMTLSFVVLAGALKKKTGCPGLFYREAKRLGGKGREKVYYVVYRKEAKLHEEKAGRRYADDMTPVSQRESEQSVSREDVYAEKRPSGERRH